MDCEGQALTDDSSLLNAYVKTGDERAFRQLVDRHIDLVYAAARRQVGDAHLAEDVAQAVFVVLARKALRVRDGAALPAWLISTTRFAARDMIRSETRRRRREEQVSQAMPNSIEDSSNFASADIQPLLDDALARLRERDRIVVTLRYLKGMPPPLGSHLVQEIAEAERLKRERRNVFVDTRDADMHLLNNALSTVKRRGERFHLITVGPVEQLDPELSRSTISETDEAAQIRGMLQSNLFISAKVNATSDHHAVRALLSGCWPLLPQTGVYREFLPDVLHSSCLYDNTAGSLASRMQDAWHLERVEGFENDLVDILRRYDPIIACRAMDDRLHEMASAHPIAVS